ncbi:MAG: histidine kinase [Bacteroidia bacterium]|nr:histidine kinase [Bacteroidia bacterium]
MIEIKWRAGIMKWVLILAVLVTGRFEWLPAQEDWQKERVRTLDEISELMMQSPSSKKADSLLYILEQKALTRQDTAILVKVQNCRLNRHLNNHFKVDSFLDLILPLLKGGLEADRIDYYLNRGFACGLRGDFPTQIKFLDSASVVAESLQDSLRLQYCQIELSLAYQDVEDYPAALRAARKADQILDGARHPYNKAYGIRNLGVCFLQVDAYDSAFKYLSLAQKQYSHLGNRDEAMYTLALMAKAESSRGNLKRAQLMLETAVDSLFKQNPSPEAVESFNQVFIYLGEVYLQQGDYQRAREAGMQAYQIVDSLNQELSKIEALELVLRASLQKDPGAQEQFNNYIIFRDKLYSEKNQRAILEYERKYRANESEKKVLLLEQEAQAAEIKMQNIRFFVVLALALALVLVLIAGVVILRNRIRTRQKIDQLNLKALQLQINPHFFFNVLNSISNFIGGNDQKSAHFYLAKFSKLMRLTLEYSRENWVDLGRELDFLDTYLELEQLRRNTFDFEIDCPENLRSLKVLPMLVQPFAENCVLHAFPDQFPRRGKILIRVSRHEQRLRIEIEDNGKGMQSGESRQEGVEKTSLAIDIMEERLLVFGREKGKVSFEKAFPAEKEFPGTRVILDLPLN